MKVKEEKLKELESLGFKQYIVENYEDDDIIYYEKNCDWGERIIVGSRYTNRTDVEFYQEVNSWGDDEEITKFVPIWAFPTIVKMVQMGFIEE